MPRLTFVTYCERYKLLRKTWEELSVVFAHLLPHEQWDLFDYFKLHEELGVNELKAHWAEMYSQSSLPQKAGRAYKQFTKALTQVLERRSIAPIRSAEGKHDYEVKVYGQVQPDIDVKSLAQVVIMLGRQLQEESQRSGN